MGMEGTKAYKVNKDLEYLYSILFELYDNKIGRGIVSGADVQYKAIILLSAIKEYPRPKIIKSLQGKEKSGFWAELLYELFADVDTSGLIEALKIFYRDLEGDNGYNISALHKVIDEFLDKEYMQLPDEVRIEFEKRKQELKERKTKKEMDSIYELGERLGMKLREPEEIREQERLESLQRRMDRGDAIHVDEADAAKMRQLQNEQYYVDIDDSVKVRRG